MERERELRIYRDLLWLIYNGHSPIVEMAGEGLALELWDPTGWYTGRAILVERFLSNRSGATVAEVRARPFLRALYEARTRYVDGDQFKVAMEKLEAERVRLRDEVERQYREEGA